MARADGAEVEFSGGERSGTRWANSTITTNLIQFDQQLTLTVRHGNRSGTASTREFDDESLPAMVDEAQTTTKTARGNANLLPLVKGPQPYIAVDATLPSAVAFGPAERAEMGRKSIAVCDKEGTLGSGYIRKTYQGPHGSRIRPGAAPGHDAAPVS